MNETRHDQYVLDASKQTISLVTHSKCHPRSFRLLGRLLGLKQSCATTTTPKIHSAFAHRLDSFQRATYQHSVHRHIHPSSHDHTAVSVEFILVSTDHNLNHIFAMDDTLKELQKRMDDLKTHNSNKNQTDASLATPTDLINDTPTTAQSQALDLTSLQTSKHHPDFRIRNQHKTLKLAQILSDLHLHLSAAQTSQNQAAFNDICARITKAGEGLGSFAQPMPVEKADCAATKMDGGQMAEVCRSMGEGEWYRVEHGGLVEEGEGHDGISAERVGRARGVYEARLGKAGDSGSEVGAESEGAG